MDARFARGLQSLTYRPMRTTLPPDEEWVTIGYKTEDGLEKEYRQQWLVSSQPISFSIGPASVSLETLSKEGLDLTTDFISQIKKILFAPENVIETEQRLAMAASVSDVIDEASGLQSVMPGIFEAKIISQDVGYIRIRSFNVQDDAPFINEFLRLISQLPKKGLILDVRGNGGGLITAAERLLQVLNSPRNHAGTISDY